MSVSFPRQSARTQRFTLGAPRSFRVADDGSRVVYLRSKGGEDPLGCLWRLDLAHQQERCIADPRDLGADDSRLPPEERARRERSRESAGGIVAFATDDQATVAAFTLGGQLFVADLVSGDTHALAVSGPVIDPRPSPDGSRVAFVRDGALHVVGVDGSGERQIAGDGPALSPTASLHEDRVTWGLAEFIAAEEMDRLRGFWWSPDSQRLAVARVDTTPVQRWHIGDPAEPSTVPVTLAYPAAGTPNADVSLFVVDLDGQSFEVAWDHGALPYLAEVVWSASGPLTLVVQSRNQRQRVVLAANAEGADAGAVRVASRVTDERWVDLVAGVPRWLPDGQLVDTADGQDTRRLTVGGRPVTPVKLQVRAVVSVSPSGLIFTASQDDPAAVSVWRVSVDGQELERLTAPDEVAAAVGDPATLVTVARRLDRPGAITMVRHRLGTLPVRSLASTPVITTRAQLLWLGQRQLRAVLCLPSDHRPDAGPLPVLLDPYGGPHGQRAVASHDALLGSQWFADQGFAVLVADGRGTPGRGPAWERSVAGDLATAPLDDQVDALTACAQAHPGLLDLRRVAIRGWSFGGYLAALGVLRRPDVFAAAIAGAPVTDMALYDTHYTERYLGLPDEQPQAYAASSLLGDAASLRRPLLLIHGLADDNVVSAHTLRLSRALLEAGRPHTVLPLSGVTHMTSQEAVAENLLLLQLRFLQDALGLVSTGD
ncbi:MAG: prolyl oligopeptidase family serine peptidase [Euzebyaceae bacterium]|nr:prolyl oligopeptidase family serine peptidase [Euzebyaceae bacterium]